MGEHAKNYRPQILVLSGKPQSRPPLIDLANLITKHNSLLLCGDICPVIRRYEYRSFYIRIYLNNIYFKYSDEDVIQEENSIL